MKVITLSKRKFENLEPLKLSREVLSTEAQVFNFNHQGNPKVIKKLFYQEGDVFANKLYTLEMLSSNKKYLPESFCTPEALISVSGHIQGFSIPLVEGVNLAELLARKDISFDEKKYYLSRVGEILNQLKAIRNYTPLNDIYLCDLHSSNFIVNSENKKLTVIDLDSCKIKGNKSSISRYLNPYGLLNNVKGKYQFINDGSEPGYVRADENSDLYCYCLMLLSFLYGIGVDNLSIDEYYNYLEYLQHIGVNNELIDSFASLVSNKNNINPGPFIESLTEEQNCRAKRIVYQKVKNKIK